LQKWETKGMYIVLKQVSVLWESASKVHEIMGKELSLQVTFSAEGRVRPESDN